MKHGRAWLVAGFGLALLGACGGSRSYAVEPQTVTHTTTYTTTTPSARGGGPIVVPPGSGDVDVRQRCDDDGEHCEIEVDRD